VDTTATAVFVAVVGARFVLPLFIPRFPLPAILACLVLDGVDQTIFQTFGYDPPGYQGYDKAMDVFYLAVAYMATLRNWTSTAAYPVARFLYFYRLVGVAAFELTQWRPLLLIFPNTFEYFFIAYEALRLYWNPLRFSRRFWLLVAAAIWIFVKLPQEWWIHIAQLDLTDTLDAYPWLWGVIVVGVAALAVAFWRLALPRLGAPAWSLRIVSDPLPTSIDEGPERAAWLTERGRVLSVATAEKIVLIGLISVIYAQVLPGLETSSTALFLGIAAFVVVNAVIVLWVVRSGRSVRTLTVSFAIRVLVNAGLVVVAGQLLGRSGHIDRGATLFFVLLFSLITTLHDAYWPIHQVRVEEGRAQPATGGGSAGLAITE
jgi:hypothetical protein